MSFNINTRQEDDPHGLQAVATLLKKGLEDDFEQRVAENLPELQRAKDLLARVRTFAPGIEFSPYVMRILTTADKQASARLAEVA
jgi:hypothetical protein